MRRSHNGGGSDVDDVDDDDDDDDCNRTFELTLRQYQSKV